VILVLSHPGDAPVERAQARLAARGVEVVRFDPQRFPAEAQLSVGYGADGAVAATLDVDGGRRIQLPEIEAVWYRRPGRPTAHARVAGDDVREWVARESLELLFGLWNGMGALGRRFLPAPPVVFADRHLKPHQLVVAGQLGFELPPTLISNDPDAVLDFCRRHGRCITKPLDTASLSRAALWLRLGRFVTAITHRDLGYLRGVRDCPTLVQAYVEKRVEIRATVVGDQVFAAEIHSQATCRTRNDWRQYDHRHTPYHVHALPPEIEARCVALCRALGVCYGAVDLILTPDGRYVFLEINLNGEYDWIEQRTGLPITAAICDLLIGATP
jgi:hypothetical protein